MLRSTLCIDNKPVSHFTDPTVEELADRIRRLLHGSIAETRQDGRSRAIVLHVGHVEGTTHESMPRKITQSTVALGVDATAMAAIVDRSLRLLHHPSIVKVQFNAERPIDVVTATDCTGRTFEITIKETSNATPGVRRDGTAGGDSKIP